MKGIKELSHTGKLYISIEQYEYKILIHSLGYLQLIYLQLLEDQKVNSDFNSTYKMFDKITKLITEMEAINNETKN